MTLLLVACGGHGRGQADTSTDQPPDSQGDTATDMTPDNVEDAPADSLADLPEDTAEDAAADAITDSPIDSAVDGDVETDTEADADANVEADANTDTDTEAEADADADEDPDALDDAGADDSGSDPESDAGGMGAYVATWGDDSDPGTPGEPVRTVTEGVAHALIVGGPVYIAEGFYAEAVTVEADLRGGFVDHTWVHDPAGHPTTIVAPGMADTLTVPLGADVVIEDMVVESGGSALVVAGTVSGLRLDLSSTDVTTSADADVVDVNGGSAYLEDVEIGSGSVWALVHVLGGSASLLRATLVHTGPLGMGIFATLGAGLELRSSSVRAWLPVRVPEGTALLEDADLSGVSSAFELDRGIATLGRSTFSSTAADDAGSAVSVGTAVDRTAATLYMDRCLVTSADVGAVAVMGTGWITNSVMSAGRSVWDADTALSIWTGAVLNSAIVFAGAAFIGWGVVVQEDGNVSLLNDVVSGGSSFIDADVAVGRGAAVRLQNDLFWGTDSDCRVYMIDGGACLDLAGSNSCAGWNPGSCIAASGNVAGVPAFADWPALDVHLTAGSTALVDAGLDAAALLTMPAAVEDACMHDYYGAARPSGSAWDIGPTEL